MNRHRPTIARQLFGNRSANPFRGTGNEDGSLSGHKVDFSRDLQQVTFPCPNAAAL